MAEEKKKIPRARKAMKPSDRQQLESLHSILLTGPLSNPSPPPLLNEQNNTLEPNSPHTPSPVSSASWGSPAPSLCLYLSPSPSPPPSQSPKAKDEDPTSPTSPFLSLNFELKKMEEEGKKGSSPSSSNECAASAEAKQGQKKDIEMITEMDKMEKKAEAHATTEGQAMDSVKDSAKSPPVSSAVSDNQATGSSPAKTAVPGLRPKGPVIDLTEDDDEVQVTGVKNVTAAPPSTTQRPPQVISIPNIAPEEKCSTSGLKRTLSETMQRDVKRPKVDVLELEAERKITAKASSHLKLEKVVQQLVEERLRVLQLTVFDKDLQELKDRVDKIDCATKHQTALNTLQTKIARLKKTFGEANQVSENKRKQEALAAAAAAAAATAAPTGAKTAAAAAATATTTAATAAATAAKTAAAANTPPAQRIQYLGKDENRPAHQHLGEGERGDEADGAILPPAQSTPAPTSTAMVTQSSILQLITSSSKAVTTLATGITTQTPTGTLLLKTAAGSNMMGPGQPLLIQLPLSMTNGQTGTLVNFPVSSLSAANSLNKGKTSTTTTTYILKPAPITTVATSSSVAGTVSALQASTGQMSPGQISLARVVYSGGTGGINTPKAGVSVTAARTPAQSVSVAGAMSSAFSPATSGPAATGSTAPGPPQGTSMTSKTDNQATGSSPAKTAVPGVRPKGSVIDLTEDDDEVQVTGVKNVTAAPPSTTQRPPQVISIPNIAGARSSPQSNLPASSNPQLTVHHRPPLDSPIKSRAVSSTTPTRASTLSLPPLPSAPAPPGRLPPEAAQTSPPQQPQLKLVPSQTGIVLALCVSETDRTCATVESYHLYAFHQDNSSSTNAAQQHWKKFGEVKALPLPMACALTRFQSGSTYHFAVRAKDIYGRFGSFCEPQCTNGINSSSS
ncbi:activating transcription factor 7-interacting protein 1-like [Diretmus argenteus]